MLARKMRLIEEMQTDSGLLLFLDNIDKPSNLHRFEQVHQPPYIFFIPKVNNLANWSGILVQKIIN